MEFADFAAPVSALAATARLIQISPPEVLPHLSEVFAGPLPHLAVAQLSTQCAVSPFSAIGESALSGSISREDLGPLLPVVVAGRPWQGRVRIGGEDRSVLAVASDYAARGALLVFVLSGEDRVELPVSGLVQVLWDIVTSHADRLAAAAVPSLFAQSRTVAAVRTAAVAELSEAHTAALSGLLGVLRSRRVDDAQARSAALHITMNALDEVRDNSWKDPARLWGEERGTRAFQRLADSLNTLVRHSPVELELDPPSGDELLPSGAAHAVQVAARAVVLAVLDQHGVRRLRVGWRQRRSELRAVVRDDGPGLLQDDPEAGQVAERLRRAGGRLEVEAIPGWGTTHTVIVPFPLSPAPKAPGNPESAKPAPVGSGGRSQDFLDGLGERELEVLERLVLGQRNRKIAEDLHIAESTVKFHVANILTKLGVGSRGEAAAFVHSHMPDLGV